MEQIYFNTTKIVVGNLNILSKIIPSHIQNIITQPICSGEVCHLGERQSPIDIISADTRYNNVVYSILYLYFYTLLILILRYVALCINLCKNQIFLLAVQRALLLS